MVIAKGKGKAIPVQAWIGPDGLRKLRQSAHESGKIVSHKQRQL
jgi:hypothetical protein